MNLAIATILLSVSFLPYFEARNQAANFVLNPPPTGTKIELERPDLHTVEKCPACEGEGQLTLQEPDFGQDKGRLGAKRKQKKQCPVCDGRGKFETYPNPGELAMAIAQDYQRFANDHLSRGEIMQDSAFVPNPGNSKPDKKLLKLVGDTFGKPCKRCNWSGLEACSKCNGQGVVQCTNKDCQGGWSVVKTVIETKRTKSSGNNHNFSSHNGYRNQSGNRTYHKKETKINVQLCPVCEGSKYLLCPECGGLKAKPCKRCHGQGFATKGGSL